MQMRMRSRFVAIVAVVAIVGSALVRNAIAHPHVWITMQVEVLFNEDKAIAGFRYHWDIDDGYSSLVLQGLENSDGVYTRESLKKLADLNAKTFKHFHCFTYPKLDGVILELQPPQDYYMEYKDDVLSMHLTMPLAKPVPTERIKDFSFTVYDASFYIDFIFAKEAPVRLISAPAGCVPNITGMDSTNIDVQALTEAMINDPNAIAEVAALYAKNITIICPAP